MRAQLLSLSLIIYTPHLHTDFMERFVVWNVGQGAWSTYITLHSCFHFDMGGELKISRQVKYHCGKKNNLLFLTHQDWDHINQIKSYRIGIKNFCLYPSIAQLKKRFINKLAKCLKKPPWIKIVFKGVANQSSNSSSVIYLVRNQWLITGDSPKKLESQWMRRVPQGTVLLLSHHGSRTATSKKLINTIKPNMAVASARKARYGHPHKDVATRLRSAGVPLLTTEKHGHLHFSLED